MKVKYQCQKGAYNKQDWRGSHVGQRLRSIDLQPCVKSRREIQAGSCNFCRLLAKDGGRRCGEPRRSQHPSLAEQVAADPKRPQQTLTLWRVIPLRRVSNLCAYATSDRNNLDESPRRWRCLRQAIERTIRYDIDTSRLEHRSKKTQTSEPSTLNLRCHRNTFTIIIQEITMLLSDTSSLQAGNRLCCEQARPLR